MNKQKLDAAIAAAIKQLHSSKRGRLVSDHLYDFFSSQASGLDSGNHNAVCILVLAFCKEGRRWFIDDLQTPEGRAGR
jgi:hypothetical protein